MSTFDLEYTICVIQRDVFSFAAKSHREENGDPKLDVTIDQHAVTWTLSDLDHGIPETIAGTPQADRIDFYFRLEMLQQSLSRFPAPQAHRNAQLRLPPTNSSGTERREGKRVRIVAPVCRFYPLASVRLLVCRPPAFEALARDAQLHLDIETGPARLYGREIFEVHFGVQADYGTAPLSATGTSRAVLTMTHELYSTIVSELPWVTR